uniref:Zinc finger protein 865 n=1 Tax=Musca domestica TaxID=7370 RepID=A0A1I8MGJ5_MUSDO
METKYLPNMSLDLTTLCRTCMDGDSKYYQLLDYVDEHTILEMLHEIVPQIRIDHEEDTDLSTIICENCVDKLVTSYKFQQMCVDTDHQLRQLIVASTELIVDTRENEWHSDVVEHKVDDVVDEMKIELYDLDENFADVNYVKDVGGKNYIDAVEEPIADELIVETDGESSDFDQDNEYVGQSKLEGKEPFKVVKQMSRKKYICSYCGKFFDRITRIEHHLYIKHKYNLSDLRTYVQELVNKDDDDAPLSCEESLIVNPKHFPSEELKEQSHVFESFGESNKQKKIQIQKENTNPRTNFDEETGQEIMDYFEEIIEDNEAESMTYLDNEDESKSNFDNEGESNTYLEIDQCPDMGDTNSAIFNDKGESVDYMDNNFNEIERPKPRGGGHYPCEVCGKVFNNPSRLRRHSPVHSLDKPYACEICKHRFTSLYYLKIHKESHNKDHNNESVPPADGYKCPECPKRFQNQPALASHRQVHSRKLLARNVICDICQKGFLTTKTLVDHIKARHPNAKKYQCDQCDKKFLLEERLMRHMATHKDLMCSICNKEFTSEPTLKEHMNIHSGACPYLCSECGKAFKFASSLRKHIERHSDVSKHQCPQCPRSFKCRSDLNKHIKIHLGLKPYKCEICNSKFTRAFNLEQHKRLHGEQSLHKCEVCGVTFSSLNHLRRHVKTHTSVKEDHENEEF